MKQRTIFRWLHILMGIPMVGYIYSPFDLIHYYANYVRFLYVPLVILTGVWMWKGQAVLRLFRRRPVKQQVAESATSTAFVNQA